MRKKQVHKLAYIILTSEKQYFAKGLEKPELCFCCGFYRCYESGTLQQNESIFRLIQWG